MRLDPITPEEYQKYTEYLDGTRYISDSDYYEWKWRLGRLCVKLVDGIRNHRDQKGDDKCWMDDEELYKLLPEGYTPPERDTTVELANCEQYIKCRRNPATTYVSPQRRIEELEKEVAHYHMNVKAVLDRVKHKYPGYYVDCKYDGILASLAVTVQNLTDDIELYVVGK